MDSVECVNITIIDDQEIEDNETFLLILHTTDQAIAIDPEYAFVVIHDDDTKFGTGAGIDMIHTTIAALYAV